jgi:hypothetical protein
MSWVKDDYWPQPDEFERRDDDKGASGEAPPAASSLTLPSASSSSSSDANAIEPSCRAVLHAVNDHVLGASFAHASLDAACTRVATSAAAISDAAVDLFVFPLRGMPEPARTFLYNSLIAAPATARSDCSEENATACARPLLLPAATEEEQRCFVAFSITVSLLALTLLMRLRFRKYVRALVSR